MPWSAVFMRTFGENSHVVRVHPGCDPVTVVEYMAITFSKTGVCCFMIACKGPLG